MGSDSKPLAKILCVDDEPAILAALERLLKSRFQVLTADTATQGLHQLRANLDCAIVLSDYRMPDMNGVDFLRQARAVAPLASRAILSGQIDLHQVAAALNASDIHKFFLKPWENDHLLLQILEAEQMHRTLQEKAHFEILAITDPVTQLTNHRHFQDQLRILLERARSQIQNLALVLFDVDHFKTFNDRFGHPEGDRLLRAMAMQMQSKVGGQGLVSRYGGEEFTAILVDCDIQKAMSIAESVRLHFEHTPFVGQTSSSAYVTVSGGVAVFPAHAVQATGLIECADRALYQAKRQGRNQIVLSSSAWTLNQN